MARFLGGLLVASVVVGATALVVPTGRAGARTLCDDSNPPASCDAVDPRTPQDPTGALDQAVRQPGGILVSGWANDRNRAGAAMTVVITVGTATTSITAATPRPDGAVGYQAVVPTSLGGNVSVCATAINVGAGNGDRRIGCRTLAVAHDPIGNLDAVSSGLFSVWVHGWAIDPDTGSPISVHVYEDGAFVGAWTADVTRTDVGAAYPGYGAAHGFDIVVPHPSTNTSHTICVYGINVSTGTVNSQLGCQSFVETHNAPTAPTIVDLHAWQQTAGANDQLSVWFQDNSVDEWSFEVMRQGPSGDWVSVGTVPGTTTTGSRHIDSGTVSPLTNYCFVVYAYGAFANSSTGVICTTTPALPPTAPSNLVVTTAKTSASVTWTDNATDEQGFELYTRVPGANTSSIQLVAASPGTGPVTATVSALQPATTYCFQVAAFNQRASNSGSGGRTSFGSNELCIATQPPDPPAAPSALTVTGHTSSSLTLGWADNATNETGYRVDRQQGAGWASVANLGTNSRSFNHTGLSPSTAVCYRVVAINAGGETPSGTVCGTTDAPPPDLVVTNMNQLDGNDPTVNAGLLHSGEPFILTANLCNVGGSAGKHTIELDVWDGQSWISRQPVAVPSLAAGACTMAFWPFPSGLAAGQYDTFALADSANDVKESNESNNVFRFSFNILS